MVLLVKNLPASVGDIRDGGSIPGLERSPGERQYSCLENPHGQRSLVAYSLWGHKESDMTEQPSTEEYIGIYSWSSKTEASSGSN